MNRRLRGLTRPCCGIGAEEIYPGDLGLDHIVNGVPSPTADAYDFGNSRIVVPVRWAIDPLRRQKRFAAKAANRNCLNFT